MSRRDELEAFRRAQGAAYWHHDAAAIDAWEPGRRDPARGAPRKAGAAMIPKAAVAQLRRDISNRRHALTFDHRGVSFSNDSWLSRRA
jgi:hypothetical protein